MNFWMPVLSETFLSHQWKLPCEDGGHGGENDTLLGPRVAKRESRETGRRASETIKGPEGRQNQT